LTYRAAVSVALERLIDAVKPWAVAENSLALLLYCALDAEGGRKALSAAWA
jgi:hypothetical protein